MRFVSIASGSSGNCTYIGSDHTHILVDAGISCKKIETSLHEIGVKASELNGIFITHEHTDHIQGIRVLCKKYGIPIYASMETIIKMYHLDKKKEVEHSLYQQITAEQIVPIGDLEVHPFSISHDAANPLAYRVNKGEKSVAVVTDLGCYDEHIVNKLQGLHALLLEANHDISMLEFGSYPYHLKRRVLGDSGHLSNEMAGKLLSEIINPNLQSVMLGHLSKENNMEELAYETVGLELEMNCTNINRKDIDLFVAKRDQRSKVIEV